MSEERTLDDELAGLLAEAIDKDTPIPYHYQLRELLRDCVESGRWAIGEQIASERELCEALGLSRTTVRHAIDALVNEGLLRREKGRGTFVAKPKILEGLLRSPAGFTDSMREQGYQVVTRVLSMRVGKPPRAVARDLELEANELVTIIDRLRFVLDEPILTVTSYVPVRLCPNLASEDLTHNALYHILAKRYGLRVVRAKRFIDAVAANEMEASLLEIEPGAPLTRIVSTSYTEDGTALEYFEAHHRGDRTRFLVESYAPVLTPRLPGEGD